tara:strand:+ start:167 stop:400 length:234 start_codon:yes stop_codon:yes gene_type:complete
LKEVSLPPLLEGRETPNRNLEARMTKVAVREEDAHIYRMVDFWNDIRNGKHDGYLDDMQAACLMEINARFDQRRGIN